MEIQNEIKKQTNQQQLKKREMNRNKVPQAPAQELTQHNQEFRTFIARAG